MKISHSAIRTYSECGRKYKYHYIDRLRSKTISGALIFGGAIDHALNQLVKDRDLNEAYKAFDKSFRYNFINNVGHYIPESPLIVYAKTDYDYDLILPEDNEAFKKLQEKLKVHYQGIDHAYKEILSLKESIGWENINEFDKILYNKANWLSMRRKGHAMIKSWYEQVLPRIKEVLAVQKAIKLTNDKDDQITGFIDLIVEMDDGKRYVMDNKTSARDYESDSAMRSQQLIVYYHAEKEEFKLNGVGFFVMYKHLNKNKKKICSVCQFNGSGKNFKTCNNEVNGSRCNGEWQETVDPKARIDIILNEVSEIAENLVMDTFDEANEGIKQGNFTPNLEACKKGGIICPYYQKCWFGKENELVKIEKNEK